MTTSCSDFGVIELLNSKTTKASVNGLYLYAHYAVCTAGNCKKNLNRFNQLSPRTFILGKYFAYQQTVNVSNDFPYGMGFDYLAIVQPFGLLRLWISDKQQRSGTIHLINLNVNFLLANNLVQSKNLSTTYDEGPTDADDKEYTLFLGQLSGFDSIMYVQGNCFGLFLKINSSCFTKNPQGFVKI